MIFESSYWKDQLLRDAGTLRRLSKTVLDSSSDERELARLERLIFVNAYAMRKLWESGKLSTSWRSHRLPCLRFAFIGDSPPDALTAHKIDRFYELDSPRDVNLKPDEFCDRVIHSFVFVPAINEDNNIQGFHFTSDRLKAQCLWFVNLVDIIELMTKTGKDYPSYGVWIRSPDGSLSTWAGHITTPVCEYRN